MDRRWGVRRTVGLDALLYHGGVPVLRCRTRDLGVQGLALRTPFPAMRAETPVELELVVPHGGHTDRLRLPATVAHVTPEGVGLHFHVFDPGLLGRILELRDAGTAG